LEENNLETTLPSNVGMVFFIHPRDSLMAHYHEQLKATFIAKPIPEFKRAHVLLIQTTPEKVKDFMRQFDEVAEMNPYEYISWKNWLDFHYSHKKVTIKAHNQYMVDYKLINISGFKDDSSMVLGKINKEKGQPEYNEHTFNEFMMQHYVIKNQDHPIFVTAMGPFLGMRLFITSAKLESAGKRLLEQFLHDTLRYMTSDAARKIFQNHAELERKARTNPQWAATWFENKSQNQATKKRRNRNTKENGRKRNNKAYIIITNNRLQKSYQERQQLLRTKDTLHWRNQ
jgi:hypothetical protein